MSQNHAPIGISASLAFSKIAELKQNQLKGIKLIMEIKTLAAHWINIVVDMSETVNGERIKRGEATIPVPTLKAFGIDAPFKLNEKGEVETDSDGMPFYAEQKDNFLQDCIITKVVQRGKNQHIPKTATLKDGKSIAVNFDELFAESERDGTHLKNRAEAVKAFTGFLVTSGIKEVVADVMAKLFRDKESLSSQTEQVKAKMKARIEAFVNTLDAEALTKYSRTVTIADEACATAALDVEGM